MINFLTEILSPGDQCVCVFIQQRGFQKNLVLDDSGGISKSGIWKLNEMEMAGVNKVVIYYRHDGINEIFIGNYKGISPTIFHDHYCINFQILQRDETLSDWSVFRDADSSLVKYFQLS